MVKFIFPYITQFRNLTDQTLSFRVDDSLFSISDLPPGKTRMIKLSRIIRCCRERDSSNWKIEVLIDGQFTGMKMTVPDVLDNVRILFNHGIIEGVREDKRTDYLLRDRFLGWMRNRFWDKRPKVMIATVPSKMASDLRSPPPKEHTRNARESISLPRKRSRRGTSIAAHSRVAADKFEMEETPNDLKKPPLARIPSPQRPASTKEHTTGNAQESISLPRERSRRGTRIAAHSRVAADRFEMEETPTDLKTAPLTRISSPRWSAPPEEHTRNDQERILSQESTRRDTRTAAHNRVVTGNGSTQASIMLKVNIFDEANRLSRVRAEERIVQDRHVAMDSFVYIILFILALTFTGFLHVSMG